MILNVILMKCFFVSAEVPEKDIEADKQNADSEVILRRTQSFENDDA